VDSQPGALRRAAHRLTDDESVARDELGMGDMWNSNSVVA
jgi:hypothetical protein